MRRSLLLFVCFLLLQVVAIPAAFADIATSCADFPLDPDDPDEVVHLVIDTTIDGNLSVPSGVGCVLINSTVNGNVTAEDDALFTFVVEGSSVEGNVDVGNNVASGVADASIGGNYVCDECVFEDVVFSEVGGNVEISGEQEGSFIEFSIIGGNVKITDSEAGGFLFTVIETTVMGNVILEGNTGPLVVAGSTIYGNLKIKQHEFASDFGIEEAIVVENSIGGNLVFNGNSGNQATIAGNTIEGNLTCRDNQPDPDGGDNTANKKKGQCRDL